MASFKILLSVRKDLQSVLNLSLKNFPTKEAETSERISTNSHKMLQKKLNEKIFKFLQELQKHEAD